MNKKSLLTQLKLFSILFLFQGATVHAAEDIIPKNGLPDKGCYRYRSPQSGFEYLLHFEKIVRYGEVYFLVKSARDSSNCIPNHFDDGQILSPEKVENDIRKMGYPIVPSLD